MTIRLRLTFYWAAIIASILVVAGFSILVLFERQQWGALDSALMEEADTASATLSRLSSGPPVDAIVRRLSQERDLGPRRRVRIVTDGQVISDFGDPDSQLPSVSVKQAVAGVRDGPTGGFRFAILPFRLEGAGATLEDGVDVSAIRQSIARLRTSLLLLLPLILLGAVSGGYFIAGHALFPITALADDLARIKPHDLSRRIDHGKNNDEVARLRSAINALLDRVQRAANAERRFAADAAHELRTPLTVLRTGLEVTLTRERASAEYVEALCAAFSTVVALCEMADQLLTLARLDQETSLSRECVDLGALLREVADAVDPLVQSKALALTVKTEDGVIVEGNPSLLKRVVINLVDNAIKFTVQHDRIEIRMTAKAQLAIVRIADSGPGIPPGDLPFIFDRFFRAGGHDKSGGGLGLSLCREIVQAHSGEITAANCAAGGCEFVMTLPRAS